jgi:hypothetical protein
MQLQEVIMTVEKFAEAVDQLIVAAREDGLSDELMTAVLEEASETLYQRSSDT